MMMLESISITAQEYCVVFVAFIDLFFTLTMYNLTIDFSILTLVALRAQNFQKIIQKIIQTLSPRLYFLLIFRFNFLLILSEATPHNFQFMKVYVPPAPNRMAVAYLIIWRIILTVLLIT